MAEMDERNQGARPAREPGEGRPEGPRRFGPGGGRDEGEGPRRFGAGAQGGRPGGGERRGRRGGGGGRFPGRRKVCGFCVDNIGEVDYKDVGRIRRHLAERGKIEPRRKYGTCAKHQRSLTRAIKRARHVALLPYTTSQRP